MKEFFLKFGSIRMVIKCFKFLALAFVFCNGFSEMVD